MRPFAATVLVLTLSTVTLADEKPVKWEYAELVFRNNPVARPGAKDADNKDAKDQPPAAPGLTIRWTGPAGEFNAKGWGELAENLKLPFKAEGTATSQRIQMLNLLGAEGWELIERQATGTFTSPDGSAPARGFGTGTTWLFKRRAR